MVSRLTKQKIRDIWKTEDKGFTPWLVQNIALLNEDLGLNIQDPESEKKLDTFKVDIVAEDEEGKIIIENQFEKSNHDHLGKLLTYISNIENTRKDIEYYVNLYKENNADFLEVYPPTTLINANIIDIASANYGNTELKLLRDNKFLYYK